MVGQGPVVATVKESTTADTSPGDLRRLARGTSLNLAGSGVSAVVNLLLPIVVTRRLASDDAGIFFSVTALVTILVSVGTLGADTGVLWSLPRAKALDRRADVRLLLRVATVPVVIMSLLTTTALIVFAPHLAAAVVDGPPTRAIRFERALYVLAPFLPVVSVYGLMVSTSRGLGSIKPLVVIEKIGRNAAQTILVSVALVITPSLLLAIVAWGTPYLAGLAAMGVVVLRLLRVASAGAENETGRPVRELAAEFWGFCGPRALSRVFSVALQRLDILIVSAFLGLTEAAVYAAASRFLLLGLMFVQAIQQVMAPRISEFLARRETGRARLIYETTTAWLILVSWPIYLISGLFASFLLQVFGAEYVAGATVVVILCLSMLLATACGPVDVVLLMGGRSRWSMLNTGTALVVNVGLDLVLVPQYGITGAALGWSAGIAVNNLLPLYQVHRFVGIHPFGTASVHAMASSLACFGLIGLGCRLLLGPSAAGLAAALVVGGLAYLAGLWWWREQLALSALTAVMRRRRHNHGDRSAA